MDLLFDGYLRMMSDVPGKIISSDITAMITQYTGQLPKWINTISSAIHKRYIKELFKDCDWTGDDRLAEWELKRAVIEFANYKLRLTNYLLLVR